MLTTIYHISTINLALIHSAVYNRSLSSGHQNCSNAQPNDTCHYWCDMQPNITRPKINCGDAGQCIFHCEVQSCFANGILTAVDVFKLSLNSNAANCMSQSLVNVPKNGDAILHLMNKH